MNFNEELTLVGELELTDSELETVSGGWRRRDYDDFPYYYYPRYYYPRPWWDEGYGEWGGWGDDEGRRHREGGDDDDRRHRR